MLLYQNNPATITALTGKVYVPELQKINMFVNTEVKVRVLVAETPLFLAPLRNFKNGQNTHFLNVDLLTFLGTKSL